MVHALQVNLDEEEVGQGTVHPAANFDPEADTTDLRKAIKGFGECVRVGSVCACVCVCVCMCKV